MGPGGIFRAQRHIPALLEIAREMRELCPNALLLNYANPMAMCCWALGTVDGLRFVGLCHGVQTTMDLIASYTGSKKEEIDFVAAGINHMAWFLRLERGGKDLYPILRANFEKPGYYANEKVRGEVMRHFGFFMTESTGHLSEYLPYFRKNTKALELYCDEPGFGGETGAYYHYCRMIDEKFQKLDPLSIESTKLAARSAEYCSHIIEAEVTGNVFRAEREHPQRRVHHEPAQRLLRRGPHLRGPHRPSSHAHRGPSSAACGPQHDKRHGAGTERPGGLDGRRRAPHAGRRTGSAHLLHADAQGDPVHDLGHAGKAALVAAPVPGQEAEGCPEHFRAEGRQAAVGAPRTALAIANRFGKLAEA